MYSRKLIAFQSNCRQLCARTGRLYFWTFTLPTKIPVKDAAKMWARLADYLKRHVPGFAGVRVFEEHPGRAFFSLLYGVSFGESHGLHVHFLSTRFYDVSLVRHVAQNLGWGRIHVKRVDQNRERVANYMAKYLSKKRPENLKGMRLVGYVGMGGTRTRHKDVRFYGHIQDCWAAAKHFPYFEQLKFDGKCAFVHMLNCRTIEHETSPMVEVLDMVHGEPDRRRAEFEKRYLREQPASGDRLYQLRQAGILDHAEAVHGMRFTPPSLRFPVPAVEHFRDQLQHSN